METDKSLVKRPTFTEIDRYGWEPKGATEAWELSKRFFASGLYPQFRTPEMLFTIMVKGHEYGFSALAALEAFDMINGKPAMRALGMLALIRRSPVCRYIKLVEDMPERATWEALRADDPTGKPATASFTKTEAELAGYLAKTKEGKSRDQWLKQPQVMMVWRALTKLAKREYADLLLGIDRSVEELIDDQDAIDITPVPSAAGEPQTTQELVRSKLAAQGVKLDKGEEPHKGQKRIKPDPKTEPAPPANGHEDLVKATARLSELYDELTKKHDEARAKAAWLEQVGHGKATTLPEIEARIRKGEDLLRRFELGVELADVRRRWHEVTGEIVEDLLQPENQTVEILERSIKSETAQLDEALSKAMATREPGEDG